MKNLILGITIVVVSFCGTALAQSKSSDDEKAVSAALIAAGKSWESGDMTKFADALTENCVYVDPFGRVLNGRETIRTKLQWVRDVILKKEVLAMEIVGVSTNFLGADAVQVVMQTKLTGKTSGEVVASTETFTLTRVGNDWKIALFQTVNQSEPPVKPTK